MDRYSDSISVKNRRRGLFVTDLDGTLLNDDRRLNAIDAVALQQLRRDGFVTAVATGRSNFSFLDLWEKLQGKGAEDPLPIDYVIFSTGAGIMRHPAGEILLRNSLNRNDLIFITGKLDDFDVDFMVHWPIPETRRFVYRRRREDNDDFQRRIRMYDRWAEPLRATLPADLEAATEILCIVPGEYGHELAEQISAALPMYSVIKATSPLDHRSLWIEIFPAGVSKSSGVAWLVRRLGLHRSQVGVVGNDYNDEDMLHWSVHSYVVGNSPPDLRRRYCCVAANTEGGVAEAIAAWRTILPL